MYKDIIKEVNMKKVLLVIAKGFEGGGSSYNGGLPKKNGHNSRYLFHY